VFYRDALYLTSMLDGNGRPLYRVVGSMAEAASMDPAQFVGEAVVA
jgi:hypothetical protein